MCVCVGVWVSVWEGVCVWGGGGGPCGRGGARVRAGVCVWEGVCGWGGWRGGVVVSSKRGKSLSRKEMGRGTILTPTSLVQLVVW